MQATVLTCRVQHVKAIYIPPLISQWRKPTVRFYTKTILSSENIARGRKLAPVGVLHRNAQNYRFLLLELRWQQKNACSYMLSAVPYPARV